MATMSTERLGALAVFITMLLYFSTGSSGPRGNETFPLQFGRTPFPGHVLVTGGAGFIGSHATDASDGRRLRGDHHR